MKSMVIFVVLLMLMSNVVIARDVVIPTVYETSEKVGEEETTYFYAGSKLLASKDSSGVNYHYQDRLGSDVESKSLPFGQSLKVGDRFSFTGKELDSDLYYFNARYYDSSLGRFTSVDPVPSEPAYQYVGNNPIMKVDPSGMYSGPAETSANLAQLAHKQGRFDEYERNREVAAKEGIYMAAEYVAGEATLGCSDLYLCVRGQTIEGDSMSNTARVFSALAVLPIVPSLARVVDGAQILKVSRGAPTADEMLRLADELGDGVEVGVVRTPEGPYATYTTNEVGAIDPILDQTPSRHTHPIVRNVDGRVSQNLAPSQSDLYNSALVSIDDRPFQTIYTRSPTTGDPVVIMYRPTAIGRLEFDPLVDNVADISFEVLWRVKGTSAKGARNMKGSWIDSQMHDQLSGWLKERGF